MSQEWESLQLRHRLGKRSLPQGRATPWKMAPETQVPAVRQERPPVQTLGSDGSSPRGPMACGQGQELEVIGRPLPSSQTVRGLTQCVTRCGHPRCLGQE